METVVFVFTKLYPFGRGEQYIANEQLYLAKQFSRVVFVPCEVFTAEQKTKQREIPANAEVLLLNDAVAESKTASKHILQLIGVMITEWMRVPDKSWFLKERHRYKSVLLHQSKCADVFNDILKEKFSGSRHCFYAYWIHNSSVMLGLMKKRNMISDYVVRGHSIDLYDWDWTLTRTAGLKVLPFHYFNIHSAPWIFPISEHGARYLQKKIPQRTENIKAFRLGVPESALNPYDERAPFTIVSCGGITFSKGINKIPLILAHLKFPVKWIHFGGEGNASEVVRKSVSALPSNIEVELRGHTPNDVIKKFYVTETVHLFVGISEVEGIPVSMMEAISAGIPVLASDVYGTPEVANEQTGFCVPFDTAIEKLADIISAFRKNAEAQMSLRMSARKYFSENFSAEVNYPAFCKELSKHLQ